MKTNNSQNYTIKNEIDKLLKASDKNIELIEEEIKNEVVKARKKINCYTNKFDIEDLLNNEFKYNVNKKMKITPIASKDILFDIIILKI